MTDNEIDEQSMAAIEDVMSTLSNEYNFDIYDSDDIQQEIFIICVGLMNNYTKDKGELFPFLLGAAKNRLISLIRCKYGNSNYKNYQSRMSIINTTNIDDEEFYKNQDELLCEKYGEYIKDHIIPEYKEDFLKMTEGIKIQYSKKYEILNYVRNCMNLVDEFND